MATRQNEVMNDNRLYLDNRLSTSQSFGYPIDWLLPAIQFHACEITELTINWGYQTWNSRSDPSEMMNSTWSSPFQISRFGLSVVSDNRMEIMSKARYYYFFIIFLKNWPRVPDVIGCYYFFFFKLIPEALLPVASGRSGRSGNSIVIVVYFRSWIIRQNSGAVSCAVYFAEPPVSFCAQKIASHGNEICQNLFKKKNKICL